MVSISSNKIHHISGPLFVVRGLVKIVLAYHFFLNLPATFYNHIQVLFSGQVPYIYILLSTIFNTVTGHSRRKIRFPEYKATGGKVGRRARKSTSLIKGGIGNIGITILLGISCIRGGRHLLKDCLKATKCTQNVI